MSLRSTLRAALRAVYLAALGSPRKFSRRVVFFFRAYSDWAKLICRSMPVSLLHRATSFCSWQSNRLIQRFPRPCLFIEERQAVSDEEAMKLHPAYELVVPKLARYVRAIDA
jgi:hypothetical protein